LNKVIQFVVIIALTVLTVLLLYTFRTFDDDRFVRWEWVFRAVKITRVLAFLIPGAIVAFILSRSSVPERYPVPFLFILSFGVASMLWSEPEMIVDASRYFTQAKNLELYGTGYFLREWGKAIEIWTDLPLMPFIYGIVFRFLGEARIYVQLVTTLLFSSTVVLTYLTGKTLWDRETGFRGGMFLLGIPYLFTQVPLMLVDTSTMFFFMLAVFMFIKGLQRGGLWVPAASAALFLVIFSKYSAWLMLSLLVIITAVSLFQIYRSPEGTSVTRCCFRATVIVVVAALAGGALMLFKYNVLSSQIGLLLAFQKPGLGRWSESFVSTFLFQVHPVLTVSAFFSMYVAWKKKDPKYMIICWLMALIVALRIERIRYTIIAFPMFSLMAAYGLNALNENALKRCIVFSVAAWSITLAVFAYLPFLQKTSARNLQSAGAFINTLPGKDIEVITLPGKDEEVNMAVAVPVLDLFTDKEICYAYRMDGSPPPEEIAVSSLRFTWSYKNPEYYEGVAAPGTPIAIIRGDRLGKLPEAVAKKLITFGKSKSFSVTDHIWRHQTFVTVYY